MKFKALVMTVMAVALSATLLAQDRAREQKLQQAIDLLETKGDVARAMPLLEDVAKSADQALAARGLLYLGQAQERQGNARARATYERIVREFANQQQIVTEARSRLLAMGERGATSTALAHRAVWTLPDGAWDLGQVSRDGRYLLYFGQNRDLRLHDFSGAGGRVLVPKKGDVSAEWASLSTDARQLAYTLPENGGKSYSLHVIAVGAIPGQSRQVFADPTVGWLEPYEWSPDGQWISASISSGPARDDIALISLANGSRRTLKKGSVLNPTALTFSPDGKYLAHDAIRGDARDIAVIPVAGGEEIAIASHRAEDRLVGWSPDGKALLFTSDRSGAHALWQQRFDGAAVGAPELLKADMGNALPLGVTRQGGVFFLNGGQRPTSDLKIGSFNFASGEWTSRAREIVDEYFTGSATRPDLSPDGKRLAYIVSRASPVRVDSAVAIRDLDSRGSRELKLQLDGISNLRWAPEGDALVLVARRDGRSGLWRLTLPSGELTPVDVGEAPIYNIVRWSADGRQFYFRRRNGSVWTLYSTDWPSGANTKQLLQTVAADGPVPSSDGKKVYFAKALGGAAPYAQSAFIERDVTTGTEREILRRSLGGINLSPDGRFIATGSNDLATKTRSILVIPVAGGQPREVLQVPLPERFIAGTDATLPAVVLLWAKDSRSLLLRSAAGRGTPNKLWWVPSDGRAAAKVILEDWRGSTIRVHPDGQRLVFDVSDTEPPKPREIWVLENAVK